MHFVVRSKKFNACVRSKKKTRVHKLGGYHAARRTLEKDWLQSKVL